MSKLRERMIQDFRIRNYSIHTETAYIRYVRRYAEHFGKLLSDNYCALVGAEPSDELGVGAVDAAGSA